MPLNDAINIVWESFQQQPCGERHVSIPYSRNGIKLDPLTLQEFNKRMVLVAPQDRPKTLSIGAPFSGDEQQVAKLTVELLELCKRNLRALKLRHAESLYADKIVHDARHVLKGLASLELEGVRLSDEMELLSLFSSNKCKISSLSTSVVDSGDSSVRLMEILATYNGLRKLSVSYGPDFGGNDMLINAVRTSPSQLVDLELSGCSIFLRSLPTIAAMMKQQEQLSRLDLSYNDLFATDDTSDGFSEPTDETNMFAEAVAAHPSLTELNIKQNQMTEGVFESLLKATERNSKLWRLDVYASVEFTLEAGVWANVIPSLKSLRSLVGPMKEFGGGREWKRLMLPILHQNTSLTDLGYYVSEGDHQDTAKILNRNKLLMETAPYTENDVILPLSMWPRALERLASEEVDASALFHFLYQKTSDIPESPLLLENRRLMAKMKSFQTTTRELLSHITDKGMKRKLAAFLGEETMRV